MKEGSALVPTSKGRILSAFLDTFFARWVDYGYTSEMESSLDAISSGALPRLPLLRQFWTNLSSDIACIADVDVTTVLERIDARLDASLFPPSEDGSDPRACPQCTDGRLRLALSSYGGFIGCSNYRSEAVCSYKRVLSFNTDDMAGQVASVTLGEHPVTGSVVTMLLGPYGWCAFPLLRRMSLGLL